VLFEVYEFFSYTETVLTKDEEDTTKFRTADSITIWYFG
jgi:hypothetical protein